MIHKISVFGILLAGKCWSDEVCPKGGCEDADDTMLLQVNRARKDMNAASRDNEEVAVEERERTEKEEDDFLRELYSDPKNLPTDEDWWIPLERSPDYIKDFHFSGKNAALLSEDPKEDSEEKEVFDTQVPPDILEESFGTSGGSQYGSCSVNEEGVNVFWSTCAAKENSVCGKGCYLWNYPCRNWAKKGKGPTVFYSDLVMPSIPWIGVEMITNKTAPDRDHLFVDAGHWMTPAIPDPPYILNLGSKYGWGHILNPYTARTSHQMHIAVRKLSNHGLSLVKKIEKKTDCQTEKWVSQKVGMCKMGQAAIFDTIPGAFSVGLKHAMNCNGCLGEFLLNPQGEITMGTIGVTLLYTKNCGGTNTSLLQEGEEEEDEDEVDEEEDEEDGEEEDEEEELSSVEGSRRRKSRGRSRAVIKEKAAPKKITGKKYKVKPIILLTSNGKHACSIKYSIS